jgi:hypothetical protein
MSSQPTVHDEDEAANNWHRRRRPLGICFLICSRLSDLSQLSVWAAAITAEDMHKSSVVK